MIDSNVFESHNIPLNLLHKLLSHYPVIAVPVLTQKLCVEVYKSHSNATFPFYYILRRRLFFHNHLVFPQILCDTILKHKLL